MTYMTACAILASLSPDKQLPGEAVAWEAYGSPQQKKAIAQWRAGNLIAPALRKRIQAYMTLGNYRAATREITSCFKQQHGIAVRAMGRLQPAHRNRLLYSPDTSDVTEFCLGEFLGRLAQLESEDQLLETWRFGEAEFRSYIVNNYPLMSTDYVDLLSSDPDSHSSDQLALLVRLLGSLQREWLFAQHRLH